MPRLVALIVLCVAGPSAAALTAVAQPEAVVLGQDEKVLIRLEGLQGDSPVLTAASAGTLLPTDDPARFVWTPPAIRYPTRALIAFWQGPEDQPPAIVDLPLLGRTSVELDTEPGATVSMRVADQVFGPVRADQKGRVQVPIIVPPGVRTAEATATANGQQTRRTVALQAPRTRPFTALLAPRPLSSTDGGLLFVVHDGALGVSSFRVDAQGATVEHHRADPQVLVFRVSPEPASVGRTVRVQVGLSGSEEVVQLEADVVEGPIGGGANDPAAKVSLTGLVGGFVGGGANRGFLAEAGASYGLPVHGGRLAAELVVGLRRQAQTFPTAAPAPGPLHSEVWAFPISVGARYLAWQRGPLAAFVRAGAGPVPFRHQASAAFQPGFAEGGVGFHAFAGAQAVLNVRPVELVFDVRADLSDVRTPHLEARPGGFVAALGARWALPW